MNIRTHFLIIGIFLFFIPNSLLCLSAVKVEGDTTACLIAFELEQLGNGDIQVSMTSDTTWTFPNNIVSTTQITLKVPTGQVEIGAVTNLLDNVIFIVTSEVEKPAEATDFDYISFGLGNQGTSDIPFEKGRKVPLFSFNNTLECNNGVISLMNNYTDPFIPPNMQDANVGQQITVSGFALADVPIAIIGDGVSCDFDDVLPPNLGIQIVSLDISCASADDGLIIAKANGGTEPYSYNWSTGDTLSTIENLPAGTYDLTVTDDVGIEATTSVTLTAPTALDLSIETMGATGQMNANGTATASVSGGTEPYQYAWSNSQSSSMITDLLPGDYSLTVTDANNCTVSQNFSIDVIDCPTIDVMLDMRSPDCPGDSTGSLRVVPLTGMAPFSFLWETGDTTDNLAGIPSGTYMVNITDAQGCEMGVSALLPDADPILIQLTADDGVDMDDGSISSSVSGGAMPYTYAWSNGNTNPSINSLSTGVYELTVTDANGCQQTASAIINPAQCSIGLLDTLGQDLVLDTINCLAAGKLCLPIPLDSMVNYTLFLDGFSYMESITGCEIDTFFAYTYFTLPFEGKNGPYNLSEWTINTDTFSGGFQDITALVDSMNLWDVYGTWSLDTNILIIQGGISSNQYGKMTIETPLTSSTTNLDLNTNLTPKGTEVSFLAGSHELILVDNRTTCSDTLSIVQPCNEDTDRDTTILFNLEVDQRDSLLLTTIFGDDLTISLNECPENSDGNAMAGIMNDAAIFVAGLTIGTDEFCYTIIDANGNAIGLTVQVNVVEDLEIHCESFVDLDTFVVEVPDCQTFEVCVPLLYDSLLNYSILDNGMAFSGIQSACDNGTGSLLNFTGPKTHQLIFTNSEGCLDTTIIAIHAPVCDEDLVIIDTVEMNGDGRTCIEFAGLPSPFTSVTDLCPEKNGEMTMMSIDGVTGCIDYTGVELGNDTACIEVCNIYGFCDTITLIVIVISSDLPPSDFDAVNDSTTTTLNEPVVFNALGNDIFSTLDDMYLVSQPNNGTATFNLDGTIRYEPATDFCNDSIPETFQYAICLGSMCDTATASILVECRIDREFFIYNALSPNGDNINDVFKIKGIENYPNNEVQIYNRWGNMVYQMKGYKNEWNGNWGRDGDLLPDGTYFFIFDTGEGDLHSGYLEIQR